MTDYNLGTARGRIVLDTSGARQGADETETQAGRIEGSFQKASKGALAAGGTLTVAAGAVAAGFGFAINSAAQFEKQISGIAAVSGSTGPELDKIREKAMQLGKDTQFSASEAAQAMEELVKAGIPVEDVLNGAADGAVALAAAGGVGIPEAATLASNAMNAFNIDAKDLAGVVDSIAGAANASAIDVGEFGQSLQQVGAVANLAGLSFDETAVAIAELGNAGIKGSDAGTSIKTFLQNLIPVTDKEKGLMEDLGLIAVDTTNAMEILTSQGIKPQSLAMGDVVEAIAKYNEAHGGAKAATAKGQKQAQEMAMGMGVLKNQFFDAKGEVKDFAQVQEVLAKSLTGMTKEQKLAALQTIFGSDAIRAAAVFADNGAKGFTELATAMGKTSAAEVAAKRMDNFAGRMEMLKGSVETMAIAVGTALLPVVEKIVKVITSLVNGFLNLSPGMQKAIIAFVAIMTAIIGVAGIILTIAGAIGVLMGALAPLAAVIGITSLALMGWIVVIVLIVAAVVALAILIYMNFDTIKSFVMDVMGAIKDFFVDVWNAIYDTVSDVLGAVLTVVKAIFGVVLAYWKFVFNIYKTIAMTAFKLIVGFIKLQLMIAKTVITTVLAVIMAIWKTFWGIFGGLITAVFNLIISLVKLGMALVHLAIYLGMEAIKAVWTATWNFIKGVVTTVFNAIKAVIVAAFNFLKPPITNALNWIKTIFTTVFNAVKSVVITAFNAIKGPVSSAIGFVRSTVQTGVDTVMSIIRRLASIATTIGGYFQSAYIAVRDKIASVISLVTGIAGRVLSALGNTGQMLYNAGKEIIQGLIDGITSMIDKVTGVVSGITDKIGGFIPGSPVKEGALKSLNHGHSGKQIVNMLVDGINAEIPSLRSALAGMNVDLPTTPAVTTASAAAKRKAYDSQTVSNSKKVEFNITNHNPVAEPTSVTTTKVLSRLALLEAVA